MALANCLLDCQESNCVSPYACTQIYTVTPTYTIVYLALYNELDDVHTYIHIHRYFSHASATVNWPVAINACNISAGGDTAKILHLVGIIIKLTACQVSTHSLSDHEWNKSSQYW